MFSKANLNNLLPLSYYYPHHLSVGRKTRLWHTAYLERIQVIHQIEFFEKHEISMYQKIYNPARFANTSFLMIKALKGDAGWIGPRDGIRKFNIVTHFSHSEHQFLAHKFRVYVIIWWSTSLTKVLIDKWLQHYKPVGLDCDLCQLMPWSLFGVILLEKYLTEIDLFCSVLLWVVDSQFLYRPIFAGRRLWKTLRSTCSEL